MSKTKVQITDEEAKAEEMRKAAEFERIRTQHKAPLRPFFLWQKRRRLRPFVTCTFAGAFR